MSRLDWRLRPHLSRLCLRRWLVWRSSLLARITLLGSGVLHGCVVLRHELLLLRLLLSLLLRMLLLLHGLILGELLSDVRRQVHLQTLRISSLHCSHLLWGYSLVTAMREPHHPAVLLLLLHHLMLLMLLLLVAQHGLALLSLHGKRGILRKHLLLLLLVHMGLGSKVR